MSWLRQQVNFIVFSTVYGEERKIITRYVVSFSFKKRKNSSVQRKLGSFRLGRAGVLKRRSRKRAGGGCGKRNNEENCMTVKGC